MDTVFSKKNWRQKMKEIVQAIPETQKINKSKKISETLSSFVDENFPLKTLGVFSALADEVQWNQESMKSKEAFFAFPRPSGESMNFHQSLSQDLVASEVFGVLLKVPLEKAPVVNPEVLIVPALAYAVTGERLGRGKGYYDRFLKNFQGVSVGVCFDEQLIDGFPVEAHDQKVNCIITDKKIVKIKGL